MPVAPTSVLFVCLGNICRSPLAEGIFTARADARGLADRFHIDSAGTGAYHAGEPPDPRSVAVAAARGVRLGGRARQVVPADFDRFDVIVAMDRSNRRSLERLRDGSGRRSRTGFGRGRRTGAGPGSRPEGDRAEFVMMRDYDPGADDPDVPDPYYGGPGGFERVCRILERSCERLLDELAGPE